MHLGYRDEGSTDRGIVKFAIYADSAGTRMLDKGPNNALQDIDVRVRALR